MRFSLSNSTAQRTKLQFWRTLELAVQWQVKPGQRRRLEPGDPAAIVEKVKASIRAKVEHPFLDVKRLWGYASATGLWR